MYNIDWLEIQYILSRLQNGELSDKTLSQRIYREKSIEKKLNYKIAQFLRGLEKASEE